MNTRPELVRHRARLKGDDSMNETLKTCPSCGAEVEHHFAYTKCSNTNCRWNALPRREQKVESRPACGHANSYRRDVVDGHGRFDHAFCSYCGKQYTRPATPPTPQPQPAPERVCVTQFHHGGLGGAFTPEDYAGYAVPEDSRRLDYTLTSIHEAKWRAAVELAAIAEAKVKTLKQERDHASDMANAATARVADLEEKLSASRKLAQLYLEGRNQEWGRAEELQRRISVIQEAVRDIPTQFSGKAVPLG
jgi:hypothetical protein